MRKAIAIIAFYSIFCMSTDVAVPALSLNGQTGIKPPAMVTYEEDINYGRKHAIKKGREAYHTKNYQEAVQWFEIAVNIEGGSAISMYYLGMMYFLGLALEPRPNLGLAYLVAATNSGLHSAAFDLGFIYYHGFEVVKDIHAAKLCFEYLPYLIPKYRYYQGKVFYDLASDDADRKRGLNYMISAASDGYIEAQIEMRNKNMKAELSYLRKVMLQRNQAQNP